MLFGQHFDSETPRKMHHVFLGQFENGSNKNIGTLMSSRVELRAQVNYSAPTFEPVNEAPAALLVQLSQLQLRCSTSISGPQASSPRSELSTKQAEKNVIAFCEHIEIFQVIAWTSYFQSKKCKSKVVRRLKKKEKKNSSIDLQRAFTSDEDSVDRSLISSASVTAGLFPNLSCLVSFKFVASWDGSGHSFGSNVYVPFFLSKPIVYGTSI